MERSHLVPPSPTLRGPVCLGDSHYSEKKLSIPQKRRRRAQRQAVRNSQLHSASLKSVLGIEASNQVGEVDAAVSGETITHCLFPGPSDVMSFRLSTLESKVDQVIMLLTGSWQGGSSDESRVAADAGQQWGDVSAVLQYLNPSAPEFVAGASKFGARKSSEQADAAFCGPLKAKEKTEKAAMDAEEKQEKATKEAQKKATTEAKEKNEKAAKEAKEKEEKEKATKEAEEKKEKAAKEAKEKKATKEAQEKAATEAKEKNEKAAKVAKEKKDKAAKEAKEKKEKATKEAQQSGDTGSPELEDRYDPWLFLDKLELSALSQASPHSYESVCDWTPFVEFTQQVRTMGCKNEVDKCLVTVKWWDHLLHVEDIVEHFSVFAECEHESWACVGKNNVVPLRFANIGAARTARAMVMHTIKNEEGQRVKVYVE